MRSACRLSSHLACLPLLALASACQPSADAAHDEARWEAVVDTVADTVIVRTVSGRVWPTDRELVSEVAIGVLDGPDEYQFGDLRAIAVDRGGRIYALDAQVPVLRAYSREGTWEQDIGREGEGPGEYKQPDAGLAVLPDGRVAIRDPGSGRITLYRPDGEYDSYFRMVGSFFSSTPLIAEPTGAITTYLVTNLGEHPSLWEQGRARYQPDGVVDTLAAPDLGFEPAELTAERQGGMMMDWVPFAPRQITAYSPLGYYVAGVSDRYGFDLFKPDGTLRVLRDHEPVQVLPGESAAWRESVTANFRRQYPGWKWEGPPIPDVKPAYSGLYPAEDGRIWVHVPARAKRVLSTAEQEAEQRLRGEPVNPFREPVRVDVFGPEGEYLGRVWTPDGFSLRPVPVFRGDTVWAVTRDAFDVQTLHRFRLEPLRSVVTG